jgi:hypothetical protein
VLDSLSLDVMSCIEVYQIVETLPTKVPSIAAITPENARAFFRHCGFGT